MMIKLISRMVLVCSMGGGGKKKRVPILFSKNKKIYNKN